MSRPEDQIEYLTVSDPVIHSEGINKYTSYRVDCRPPNTYGIQESNPGTATTGGAGQDLFLQNNQEYSSVLRRYSDFVWLYERLHKERAGAIVPHLPEKQAVGKFSPEFVEERRRGELCSVIFFFFCGSFRPLLLNCSCVKFCLDTVILQNSALYTCEIELELFCHESDLFILGTVIVATVHFCPIFNE